MGFEGVEVQWQHQRYWHIADPHALLHKARALTYDQIVQSQCNITKPVLAALQHNRVSEDFML